MRGKKFGVWIFGNEFEQRAALVKNGMDPDKDVTLVKQQFDMVAFLKHEIDAASAMTYNELAQVLETKNPETGKLYTLKDLNVFKYSDLGTGMLQDGIFVRGDWIKDKANQAIAVKFLEATFKGWIYCRDHYKDCVNIVLAGHCAAEGAPDVADERGQRAGLAEQARHRRDEPGRLREDGEDLARLQGHQEAGVDGVLPHRPREEGGREPEEAGASTSSARSFKKAGRRAEGRRQVTTRAWLRVGYGRPGALPGAEVRVACQY